MNNIKNNAFKHKNRATWYTHIKVGRNKSYFTNDPLNGDNKYAANYILKMIEFLVDNIYVRFGGQLLRQMVGIPMGKNCTPLMADLFLYSYDNEFLHQLIIGNLRSKKKLGSNERAWKMQTNDLNAPNGSQDIPFQSQEFWQDGHRHFVGFQPHFHLNMTSQMQCCKKMKKWKCNISGVFCLICSKLCRLLELGKGISLHFKFCCHGNQNQNYCLLLKNKRSIVWAKVMFKM